MSVAVARFAERGSELAGMRWKAQAGGTGHEHDGERRAAHAGLLQLQPQLRVKIVADRPPTATAHDGIKTRATGGRSVSGRCAEALHIASFRGLAAQCRPVPFVDASRPAAVSALASSNAPQPRRVKGGITDI